MTPKEIKILLIKKGLTITGIAQDFKKESDATLRSLETMISDTLYGKRYYPSIAVKLNERYGIEIKRPKHLQPVRQQLKQAA